MVPLTPVNGKKAGHTVQSCGGHSGVQAGALRSLPKVLRCQEHDVTSARAARTHVLCHAHLHLHGFNSFHSSHPRALVMRDGC